MAATKFAGAILTLRLDTGKGEPVERVFGVDASTTGLLAGALQDIAGDTPGALVHAIGQAIGVGRYSAPPEFTLNEAEPVDLPDDPDSDVDPKGDL